MLMFHVKKTNSWEKLPVSEFPATIIVSMLVRQSLCLLHNRTFTKLERG